MPAAQRVPANPVAALGGSLGKKERAAAPPAPNSPGSPAAGKGGPPVPGFLSPNFAKTPSNPEARARRRSRQRKGAGPPLFAASRLESLRPGATLSPCLVASANRRIVSGHGPAAERCRSGRTGWSRKPLSTSVLPGFESLPLRHSPSFPRLGETPPAALPPPRSSPSLAAPLFVFSL